MKIYGIEIVHPHSGDVTRSKAERLLKSRAMEEFSSVAHISLKDMCEILIKRGFARLVIEDVNYVFRGHLE